jgi:putative transposase
MSDNIVYTLSMPIKTMTMMEFREQIAVMALSGNYSIGEIAELFRVTRPTVYKYRDRYQAGGRSGLIDRSRAPGSPHRIGAEVEARILEERRRFDFGSKKIRRRLADEDPERRWPARSTIDAVLRRHNLVQPRRRRRQFLSPFAHRYEATAPGELTTIDFKGEFRLRNRRWCYPLTMADAVSRYILVCEALPSTGIDQVWPIVQRTFREHGLPTAMLSDNGPPFGGHGVSRLSTFSVRLMELGIQPVFIMPGRPQQNGSHERMHKTLKERLAKSRATSFRQQQIVFDDFRNMYNSDRPHEGIAQDRPAHHYHSSPRPYPSRPTPIEYDSALEVRSVFGNGYIRWAGQVFFLSQALAGRRVAIEPIADDLCSVHFGSFLVGRIDLQERRFV